MVLTRLHTPSWRQGFARYRQQSAYPGLWDGLAGAWLPALGPTGSTLFDISGRGDHGILTSMNPATDWVTVGKRELPYALEFARDEMVDIPDITVTAAQGNSWGFWFNSSDETGHYPLARSGHGTSYVNLYATNYIRWRDWPGTVYGWASSPNTLDGEWHWVCGTQNADFTRLYVDGYEIPPARATAAGSYSIWQAIGEDADGQMSNTVVYRRVLALNEIRTLHRYPMALVRRRAMIFPAGVTVVTGPYNVAAGLPYVTGSVAGDAYTSGSVAGALT